MVRRLLVNLAIALFVTSCSSGSQPSAEQRFWRWFQANEKSLFEFETNQDKLIDELAAHMHKVHPSLTFEIGPENNGTRELVISAGGIREAFPAVTALAEAAPSLPRWKIIKFRPRRDLTPITYEGFTLSPEQIEFAIEQDWEMVAITLFIDGYSKSDYARYLAVAFLMLDHALGEYDVETKIGGLEVMAKTERTNQQRYPISSLAGIVDGLTNNR